MSNSLYIIDMTSKINRTIKPTRLGANIAKIAEPATYMTADGKFGVKIPCYYLKGDNESPISAVDMNIFLVTKLIQENGEFKNYLGRLKRENEAFQMIQSYTNGDLEIPDLQSFLMQRAVPIFTQKKHMITLELHLDSDKSGNIEWDEIGESQPLILNYSVLNTETIMPIIGKLNLFGGKDNVKSLMESAGTLKLG